MESISPVNGSRIIWDHRADGIHFNGKYYSLVHIEIDTITLLDIKGKLVTKFTKKRIFGRVIKFSWDIHMDNTDNIFVSCQNGVLCLSIKGEALWFKAFSYGHPKGITEINNMFYVADMFQKMCSCFIADRRNQEANIGRGGVERST